MKTNPSTRCDCAAFTRKDLLVVVAIIVSALLLASMLLPAFGKAKAKSGRIKCANNQKQIGTAYRVFASDNDGRYPLQTPNHPYIYPPGESRTATGAVESTVAQPWQVFQSLWNELQTPRVLVCPDEKPRIGAVARVWNFNGLAGAPGDMTTNSLGHPGNQNLAVSYAVQALADESRPLGLLTLDRRINLVTAKKMAPTTPPAASGSRLAIITEQAARSLFWVGEPWVERHGSEGVFSLADGSGWQADQRKLTESLLNAGTAYGWGTVTSNGFGAAVFLMP